MRWREDRLLQAAACEGLRQLDGEYPHQGRRHVGRFHRRSGDTEYVFMVAVMGLNCAFRLRGAMTLFWFHSRKSFSPRETVAGNIFSPTSSLWACDVLLFYSWGAFYVISF